MKKRNIAIAVCALTLMSIPISLVLTGCNGQQETPTNNYVKAFTVKLESTGKTVTSVEGYRVEQDRLIPVITKDANEDITSDFQYDTSDDSVCDVDNSGTLYYKGEGTANITVTAKNSKDENGNKVTRRIAVTVNPDRIAKGANNFAASSYEEKLEILASLEKYAIDNHLTGLTLFEDGGKSVYSKRLTLPVQNYITGFGFGTLSDGTISGNLPGINENTYEGHPEWASYLHTAASTGIKNICYLDDNGSVTDDLYGYISTGLYGTKLSDTKTSYEWTSLLAKGDPIPVNVDPSNEFESVISDQEIEESSGLFSSFMIPVKAGEKDGIKYSTLSTHPITSKYNNRVVQIEDYITAYRNLLTKKNGFYRGQEMTALTKADNLKGSLTYYNLTGNGQSEELFDEYVGLKIYTAGQDEIPIRGKSEETGGYYPAGTQFLVYTLTNPMTEFYAKYYLGGGLTMPVPQAFLDEVTPEAYGKGDEKSGLGVIDSILSLGAYNIEKFDVGSGLGEFVFKKNPNYNALEPNKYKIAGVHMQAIDTSDPDAVVKQFKAGRLDSCRKTKNTLNDDFSDIGNTYTAEGTSTFKLNINSCTEEEWVEYFGKNGTISQQPETDYWKVKPFMSNKNFLNGLSACIDRETYASARGVNPSQDYFANNYMWDPEGSTASAMGISSSYSQTEQHKLNLKNRFPETYGYNKSAATTAFRNAINEMVQSGQVKLPYKGELEIIWMNTGDSKEYGAELETYIESTVNAINPSFQIDVINHDGSSDYSLVYEKMRKGQFDLGFGSISGMELDPLAFLEVLKSDNSSGFTLNFGTDTSIPDGDLQYNEKIWSFDSLWAASTKGAIIGNDGIVEDEPVKANVRSVTSSKGSGEFAGYTKYTLPVDIIDLGTSGDTTITLNDKGNIATISYDDKTVPSSPTVGTQSLAFDAMTNNGNTGTEILEGAFVVNNNNEISFYIPDKIIVDMTAQKDYELSKDKWSSVDLTCSFEMSMTVGGGKKVTTTSSYSFTLPI